MNCQHCRIGHYELVTAPYVQWLDGRILVIPDAPAFSCDICGQMEYDYEFMIQLQYLLSRFANEPQNSRQTMRQPVLERPAGWPSTRRSG